MNIGEIMSVNVPSISLEADIATAAEIMRDTDNSDLIVINGGKVVGIISDRDIVRGCIVEGHISWQCSVYRHMTIQNKAVDPDTHIGNAAIVMIDGDLNHLPVVESGELVGLVSSSDIFQAVESEENSHSTLAISMI